MTSAKYDVLGIGIDFRCIGADRREFSRTHGMTKGGLALIGRGRARFRSTRIWPGIEMSGGSAANTLSVSPIWGRGRPMSARQG